MADRHQLVFLVYVNEPAVDARDLYRFFHTADDEVLALRGVTLRVERGEIVAIVGPSGSGKSTLLACLAGIDDPDGGTVHIDGERVTRRPEAARARLRARAVGVLLQSDNLLTHLDVTENVAMARALIGMPRTRRCDELLDDLGLASRRHALPAQLSGGETVRAGLAVALANDPMVLIADEPTGELDSETEQRILELLDREARGGRAVIVATHSDSVSAVADRVITLVDGAVAT